MLDDAGDERGVEWRIGLPSPLRLRASRRHRRRFHLRADVRHLCRMGWRQATVMRLTCRILFA
jgi:hypothetical protein